ncbi:MAG: hypothetical protein MHMPM18_003888 [Marteilia pararefringens]
MSNEEFGYHQCSLGDCDMCNNQPGPNSMYPKDSLLARLPFTDPSNRDIKAFNSNPAFSQISTFPWYSFGCLSEENTQSSSQDFSAASPFYQPNSTNISESFKQCGQERQASSICLQTGDNAPPFSIHEDAGDESIAASSSLLQKQPISRDSQCQSHHSTNFNNIHETHIDQSVDTTTGSCENQKGPNCRDKEANSTWLVNLSSTTTTNTTSATPIANTDTFSDPSSTGEESETWLTNRAEFLCFLEPERNGDLWTVIQEPEEGESEISSENDASALTMDKSQAAAATAPNFRAWLTGATKSSSSSRPATIFCSTTSGSSSHLNSQDRASKYSREFSALEEHTGRPALCTTNRNTAQETCDSSSSLLPLTAAAAATTTGANKSLQNATNKAPLRVAIATEEEELEEAARHPEQQQHRQHHTLVHSLSSQSEQLDKSSEAVKCQDWKQRQQQLLVVVPAAFSGLSNKTHFNHNSSSSSIPRDLQCISDILPTSCNRRQETMMTMRKSGNDAKRKPLQAVID